MDHGRQHREEPSPSRIRSLLSDEPVPLPEEEPDDPGPRPSDVSHLRPHLFTGGGVRPSPDDTLEIEAQVVTTEAGYLALPTLEYGQRDIVELCQTPMAVAEVAARLRLHLGIARVLVGDLLERGHLTARRPDIVFQRSADIIQRVIRGLQAID